MPGAELARDEGIRDGVTPESLAKLKPSFRDDGTVTAGNASQLSDGAAALLLADEDGVAELGVEPLARITGSGVDAVDPQYFGIGPVQAVNRALDKAGRSHADVTTMELNEAFAAQTLACLGVLARPRRERGQPARRGDRDRPPARLLGRTSRRTGRPPAGHGRLGRRRRGAVHRRRPGHRTHDGALR